MSDSNKDVKFSFNAVINKQKTKVLFAEIDNHLADVLLSFFMLPLGKIVRVLESHYGDEAPVFGSLTTLYHGLSNLDEDHFCGELGCKQMLLNPPSSFSYGCRKLKLDISDTRSTKYFTCEDWNCAYPRTDNIGMYHGTVRCACGKQLNREIPVRQASQAAGEDFTKIKAFFIISDDLEILPNATKSVTKIVSNLGLMDLEGTELRNVSFGFNEIMDLLKGSLFSATPLSDIILEKQMKYEPVQFHIEKRETSPHTDDMSIKVIFQKSTNKLLFVEAEDDFVGLLFSLLTISLGRVCLNHNTCLKNIDNLYTSIISPAINYKYLRIHGIFLLISASVPYGYLSRNSILGTLEEASPELQYHQTIAPDEEYLSPASSPEFFSPRSTSCGTFKSPILCEESYVKGPRKYMVMDDLTVTPLQMASYISSFIEQKIPLSDVHEMVLEIGQQEASSILKASLVSTRALSHGLGHLLMHNQSKDKESCFKKCRTEAKSSF